MDNISQHISAYGMRLNDWPPKTVNYGTTEIFELTCKGRGKARLEYLHSIIPDIVDWAKFSNVKATVIPHETKVLFNFESKTSNDMSNLFNGIYDTLYESPRLNYKSTPISLKQVTLDNIQAVATNITVGELYNSSLPKQFKICKNHERFWVEPTDVKYQVKVCNDLVNSNLKIGDTIKISPKLHVYDVQK
jgi:hypothetical protein